jgi:hypothetical protein
MALCRDEVRDECRTENGGNIKVATRLALRDGSAGVATVSLHALSPVGAAQSVRRFVVRLPPGQQQAIISGEVLDLGTSCDPALATNDFYFYVDAVGKDVVAGVWSVPKTLWTISIVFEGQFPSG